MGYLFISGKAMADRVEDMLDILADVLLTAQLGNRQRIKQMALEEKASLEARLVPAGNSFASPSPGRSWRALADAGRFAPQT